MFSQIQAPDMYTFIYDMIYDSLRIKNRNVVVFDMKGHEVYLVQILVIKI